MGARGAGANRANRVHVARGRLGATGTDRALEINSQKKDKKMNLLWAVAVVLFVMWLLGFAAFHVATGFIHILLVLAVIAVVVRLVSGPRTV